MMRDRFAEKSDIKDICTLQSQSALSYSATKSDISEVRNLSMAVKA